RRGPREPQQQQLRPRPAVRLLELEPRRRRRLRRRCLQLRPWPPRAHEHRRRRGRLRALAQRALAGEPRPAARLPAGDRAGGGADAELGEPAPHRDPRVPVGRATLPAAVERVRAHPPRPRLGGPPELLPPGRGPDLRAAERARERAGVLPELPLHIHGHPVHVRRHFADAPGDARWGWGRVDPRDEERRLQEQAVAASDRRGVGAARVQLQDGDFVPADPVPAALLHGPGALVGRPLQRRREPGARRPPRPRGRPERGGGRPRPRAVVRAHPGAPLSSSRAGPPARCTSLDSRTSLLPGPRSSTPRPSALPAPPQAGAAPATSWHRGRGNSGRGGSTRVGSRAPDQRCPRGVGRRGRPRARILRRRTTA
ncbi:unnamed protein product, partial [Prorocentrum cordatum]